MSLRIRAIAEIGGGAAIAHGVAFLALPLLARLYGPKEFGLYAVFAAFVALDGLALFGYERAIVLASEQSEQLAIKRLCLWVAIAFALMLFPVAFMLVAALERVEGFSAIDRIWWLAPLAVLCSALFQVLVHCELAQRRYLRVGVARTVQGIAIVSCQVSIGLWLPALADIGLPLGHFAGVLISALWMQVSDIDRRNSGRHDRIGLSLLREVASRYRGVPRQLLPATFLNTITLQAPTMALGFLFGASVSGSFGLCQRLIGTPSTLLASSVSQVFFSEAARIVSDKTEGAIQRLVRSTTAVMIVPACGFLLAATIAPALLPLVLGESWSGAAMMFPIVAIVAIAQLFASAIYPLVTVCRRYDVQLRVELTRVMLMAGSVAVAYAAGLSGLFSVAVICAGTILGYAYCLRVTHSLIRFGSAA